MSDDRFPVERGANGEGEPEVRLELTNAGVRQVWALYSQDQARQAGGHSGGNFGGGPPVGSDPDLGFSFPLRDLPDLLRRGKWYLAASLLLTLGLGTAYLTFAEPIFSVETLVLIEREALPLEEGDRLRPGTNFLKTQAEVIQSPAIMDRAMTTLALQGDGDPVAIESLPGMSVSATDISGTNVIALAVRTSDPDAGLRLSDALIESYREHIRAAAVASHSKTIDVLARNEQELKLQRKTLHESYEALRSEAGIIGHGVDGQVQNAILERQAQKLVEARILRVDLENQLRALRSGSNGGRLYGDTGSRIREELWRARVNRDELTQRYSEKHPIVRSLDPQIAALEKMLEESASEAPARLKRELEAARQTETRLQEMYEQELARGRELSTHRLREDELLAQIQRTNAAHEEALKGLQERELKVRAIAEGQTGTRVELLEGPLVGTDPVWPQPLLVLIPCLILGLAGGLALTLIADRARSQEAAAESSGETNGRMSVEQTPPPAPPIERSPELTAGIDAAPEFGATSQT